MKDNPEAWGISRPAEENVPLPEGWFSLLLQPSLLSDGRPKSLMLKHQVRPQAS